MTVTDTNLTQHIIDLDAEHVVQSYKRPPFVIVRGEGATLYDAEGKAYGDWVAGIAVNALGYSDPGLTEALRGAANGLVHMSNLYYTEGSAVLADALCRLSFADRVFFSNSGAEANEGAIKFARRVAFDSGHANKTELVCFTNAFHGRTLGALSLTPKEKYQGPFRPLIPGAHVAEYNNLESAAEFINENTAAVIVEPVQGEGGIYTADPQFLRGLRALCDRYNVVLIFDEIQCGMGRTGKLWAYEHTGVTPDIMTLAKPLAGGLPIGAILTSEAVASHIHPGDHGSTFGGGPYVTGVADYVLGRVSDPQFLAHVAETGEYLKERLQEINSPLIREVRGVGLMVGLELTIDAGPIIQAGYDAGLLMVNAGANVIRFVPPLIVGIEQVDQLIDRLTVLLAEQQAQPGS